MMRRFICTRPTGLGHAAGPAIQFWAGERKQLAPGVTLIRCGGHFPGGTILHWRERADGRGALLTGDILQVTPDRMVSFMFSYPNLMPLSAQARAHRSRQQLRRLA